jgi:acyl-CoA synthetase (NDP forming)
MGATSSFQSFAVEGQVLDDAMGNQIKPKVITNDFLKELQKVDESYRNEVIRLIKETQKPIIAVSFPTSGAMTPMLARQSEVVIYPSPERGAKTIAALYEHQKFLQRKPAGV